MPNNTTSPTEHWCPRRAEAPFQAPGPDRWDNRHGLVGQDRAGTSCSHCGSLNPEVFLRLVRDGWTVGPTDKSYKCYLHAPITDEERAQRKAEWESGERLGQFIRQHVLDEGGSESDAQAKVDEYWARDEEPYLTGSVQAKFYFQHLDQAQRDEFIELHNSGAMKIGYPNRFYNPPYFTRPAPAAPDVEAASRV